MDSYTHYHINCRDDECTSFITSFPDTKIINHTNKKHHYLSKLTPATVFKHKNISDRHEVKNYQNVYESDLFNNSFLNIPDHITNYNINEEFYTGSINKYIIIIILVVLLIIFSSRN